MKTTKFLMLGLVIIGLAFTSCKKATDDNFSPKSLKNGEVCEPSTFTLWAGQTNNWGTLTVWNDEENLYVKYTATTGTFGTLHLWVGDNLVNLPQTRKGNPIPGQFPYSFNANGLTEYTFSIPRDQVMPCNQHLFIVAHAEMGSETAFAGGTAVNVGTPGRWWYYCEYNICCSTTPPPDLICGNPETGFGGDNRGAGKAWWYYVVSGTSIVTNNIWAGQTMDAGDVTVYEEDISGYRAITINLGTNWYLNTETTESVKIQGYMVLPSKRPPAGLFTTYKGTALSVVVPSYPYYVIHLDLKNCVPAPSANSGSSSGE